MYGGLGEGRSGEEREEGEEWEKREEWEKWKRNCSGPTWTMHQFE